MFKQLELPLDGFEQESLDGTFLCSDDVDNDISCRPDWLSNDLGTFSESLRAPIHRWFKYPAGFSYKFVEAVIKEFGLNSNSWIIDPFMGSGTSNVTAKLNNVNSVGIEAHSFVHWVASVKCFFDYDLKQLYRNIFSLLRNLERLELSDKVPPSNLKALLNFPDLVYKCYSEHNLWTLETIRKAISEFPCGQEEKDFFYLALTNTLRVASTAGTGWPYIAPTKYHQKKEQPALKVFSSVLEGMYLDLVSVLSSSRSLKVQTLPVLMDVRNFSVNLKERNFDLAVTSPPYLNNYDYADRTRLEMYFLRKAKNWSDITKEVRDKLIIAATTQVIRSKFINNPLENSLKTLDYNLYKEIALKINLLSELRLKKGGKKSYDFMVAGYFYDMIAALQQVYNVLKPGSNFLLILGDSAPYGVYIPTDEYLGKIGLALGFRNFCIYNLRKRGDKWKDNPQRHSVPLKESVLILQK